MLSYDDAACRNPIESAAQTDPPRGWDQRRLFVCGAVMWMAKVTRTGECHGRRVVRELSHDCTPLHEAALIA